MGWGSAEPQQQSGLGPCWTAGSDPAQSSIYSNREINTGKILAINVGSADLNCAGGYFFYAGKTHTVIGHFEGSMTFFSPKLSREIIILLKCFETAITGTGNYKRTNKKEEPF